MTDQSSLQPGTVIAGDFRLVRPLSAGGMGAVYLAEQISTGKPRALKVMLPQLVADPSLRKRFEQEARIASLIESEHVVEVVGAGVDPGSNLPWLAMELLNGEDLSQLVARRGGLPMHEVGTIFEQLGHAVGAAHRVGVVHRDLKPENVFLAQAKRTGATFMVKVLDFGIAKIIAEASTKQTAAMGSPIWMAPEQADQSPVTPATDVWALGLIAFYLGTGRSFWKSGNQDATIPQVLKEVLFEPIVPAGVRASELGAQLPQGFDAWFARCVARDPAARFGDATQATAALLPVLQRSLAMDVTRMADDTVVPARSATGPAIQSTTGSPVYTLPDAPRTLTPIAAKGRVPVGAAVAILAGVALLGTVGAGAVWWVTKPTTIAATTSRSRETLDASTTTPDTQVPSAPTTAVVADASGPSDAELDTGRTKAIVAAHPARPHDHPVVAPTPREEPPPPPTTPPPAPPAAPRPQQRSVLDLSNSTVSADWWVARGILEPKVVEGTATVEEVHILLRICRNQRDGACQRMCKRVLAGKKP